MTTAVAEKTDTKPETKIETTVETKADASHAGVKDAAAEKHKTSDGVKTEPGKADAAVMTKAEVPEKYVLTLPENTPFGDADLEEYAADAKALGLSQDAAQAWVTRKAEAAKAQAAAWLTELEADPALGGAQFEETKALALKGRDTVLTKDNPRAQFLMAFLNQTGLGNHAAVVELFANIGRLVKEDSITAGGRSGGEVVKETKDLLFGSPAS